MGMESAWDVTAGDRSKLHYGECSEQTAGWSGGELQAVSQERQLFRWRQASRLYAAASQGPTVC